MNEEFNEWKVCQIYHWITKLTLMFNVHNNDGYVRIFLLEYWYNIKFSTTYEWLNIPLKLDVHICIDIHLL